MTDTTIQQHVQTNNKENTKALHYISGPLWGVSTGGQWIPPTKAQLCGKRFIIISSIIVLVTYPYFLSDLLGPGMGVTKAPFVNFSMSKIFDLSKVHLELG